MLKIEYDEAADVTTFFSFDDIEDSEFLWDILKEEAVQGSLLRTKIRFMENKAIIHARIRGYLSLEARV